ncbi:inorganic triphosphatase YgiF [Bradyrhizobium sp. AZCC 1610]|uniref:hypothetical protein n=1 Tax=Bradyrhizobium sp. AZCC 1610 TaxID=3117020 RepID=UPI002FF007FC
MRQTDGKHVQTIKKTSGTQFGRGEWETEIKGRTPDLGEANGTPLERLASNKLRRKLKPIFETSVHRIALPVRTRRSELELAIDHGKITAAGRTSRIEEVELELKKGPAKGSVSRREGAGAKARGRALFESEGRPWLRSDQRQGRSSCVRRTDRA